MVFYFISVKIYGSSNEAIGEKDHNIGNGDNVDQSKPCMVENNQSELTFTSSDEDTEDYSDYVSNYESFISDMNETPPPSLFNPVVL